MLDRLKWKNLNIGWKYGLALSVTILLFVISTVIVSNQLTTVSDNIDAMERRADRSIDITDMTSQFRSKDTRIADYIMTEDQAFLKEYETKRENFNELQAAIEPKMDTEEQLNLFKQIQANDQEANRLFTEEIVPALESGDRELAQSLRNDTTALRAETVDLLVELREIVKEERKAAVHEAKSQSAQAFWTLVGSIALSVLIGGVLIFITNRMIQGNLNKVVSVSNEVANGNLSVEHIAYNGKDEIGKIAAGMNEMVDNLRSMVNQIQEISENVSSQSEELTQSSSEVSTGSQHIASAMEQLSSASEEQASSASEISHVMGDLNRQIKESNEEGERLGETSQEVLELSAQGKEEINRSVEQMNDITTLVTDSVEKVKGLDQRSNEISKLIDVIEDIAGQTNLLALNAAIEAARAGESGKGFAVVADEVRKLAEQVGNSVSEITTIIEGIQSETKAVVGSLESGYEKVEQGNKQVNVSRDHFESINDSISDMIGRIKNVSTHLTSIASNSDQVSESVQEIAAAAEESSAGIEESSSTAQQQSSSMQEVAGSAEALSQLSEELNGLIKKFRL